LKVLLFLFPKRKNSTNKIINIIKKKKMKNKINLIIILILIINKYICQEGICKDFENEFETKWKNTIEVNYF
jgi:hypothetical protein